VIIGINLLIAFLSVPGDKQNHVRVSKSTKISGPTFTQTSRQGNHFTGYAAGSTLGGLSYALTDPRCYCQYEVAVWTSDIITRHGVEQFSIQQGFTNFPQNEEPPQNSMRQNGDMEEVPH